MTKLKRNLINFRDLNENQKDNILTYIKSKGVSIKNAALNLNVTVTTINKIFTERYGKRDKENKIDLNSRKEYFKQYYTKNKFKGKLYGVKE